MEDALDVNTLVGRLNELQKQGLGLKKLSAEILVGILFDGDKAINKICSVRYDEKSDHVVLGDR